MKKEKKVLICEDDEDILFICSILIKEVGIVPETAINIATAESKLLNEKYDLIILDYWINGKTCEELFEKIKNSTSSKAKILLMTALNKTEEISQNPNIDGIISKPFDIKQFKNTILENI